MFQFTGFPSIRYVLAYGYHLCGGFPHSDISGSMDMCSSPKLFAAYHVFHRLLVPRHPPCALTTLTVAGTIESFDSLFPHWCIALHQRALCFHFSYLVINDEIWIYLMSWLISISENEFYINSCMKFSRYIRVSETISCICYTSGLIDHAIQECLFLDRIIDKSKTLLKIRQPPIFPGRLQPSIVGRVSLNHRVRDGNGCDPDAHRHRNIQF